MPAPVFTAADNLVLLPAIVMVLFACGTLLLDVIGKSSAHVPRPSNEASRLADGRGSVSVLSRDRKGVDLAVEGLGRRWLMLFSLLGLAITATALWRQWLTLSASGLTQFTAAQGAITLDGLGFFSNIIVWGSTVLLFLTSYRFLELNRENKGEYLGLAFLAQAGMYFMATASELVTLFLGIELTAVSFYILVGFTRADKRSNEAALKYLLLGALSSGFILYGFSILYGISGSTQLTQISLAVSQRGARDPFVILAVIPIVAGVLFKISAVPFHTWAPDAYDGAPTPVTAYLSVASKVAAFAVLLRLLPLTLGAVRSVWEPLLVIASVASITVGSIAALTQIRLKRFFAYSSIAHIGYILLGVIAGTEMGWKGVYIYLLIYAVMTQGAFTLLISLTRRGIAGEKFEDLRGLSTTHPLHSALFVVLLLSLAGIPPTAGFIGKYFIFVALIETHHYALAVIAAAYVVVSLYIYFRLVREMYLKNAETREPLASSLGIRLSLYATSALTLFIGVFPEPVLRLGFRIAGISQ